MTVDPQTIRPELKYFGSFSTAFRIKAHILISWGYSGALSRIDSDSHEETTITGYISAAINNRLRAFDCPAWAEDFSIMENKPVELEGREGKKRPRPDLIVEGKMRGRPEYIFEAKRLKTDGFGSGKYLGNDGLGCFVSGKYAARYDEAGMLGYMQSNSPMHWLTEIGKKINQKKENLNFISLQQGIEVIRDFSGEWLSVHNREGVNRSITIFHILLDFRMNR